MSIEARQNRGGQARLYVRDRRGKEEGQDKTQVPPSAQLFLGNTLVNTVHFTL